MAHTITAALVAAFGFAMLWVGCLRVVIKIAIGRMRMTEQTTTSTSPAATLTVTEVQPLVEAPNGEAVEERVSEPRGQLQDIIDDQAKQIESLTAQLQAHSGAFDHLQQMLMMRGHDVSKGWKELIAYCKALAK